MYGRADDVLIGVITGVFSAVIASLFEVFFVSERFFALGSRTGMGSEVLFIASVGAIVGGSVGFAVGAMLKPRTRIG